MGMTQRRRALELGRDDWGMTRGLIDARQTETHTPYAYATLGLSHSLFGDDASKGCRNPGKTLG